MAIAMPVRKTVQDSSSLSRNPNAIPTATSQENFLREAANLQTDEEKYKAAVDLALLVNQDKEELSDDKLKSEIDTYYSKLSPEKSGREMRGENAWTDFVGGTKGAIDSFNTGVGNLLDGAFDTVVGGALDFVGAPKTADDVRNFMSGEDLAFVPDLATDVALAASGVGIPVMIAKNAVQLSPQMAQGISGKDAITLEQMDAGQQAANAALGFGGLILSAVPGVGKGVNVAKAASKNAAKEKVAAADNVLKEAVENAKTIKSKYSASDIADKNDARKEILNSVAEIKDATDALNKAKDFNDKTTFGRVVDILAEDARGLGSAITDTPSVIAQTYKSNKGAKAARGIARDVNSTLKEGERTNEVFTQKLAEKAKDKGKSFEDYAKELSINLDNNNIASNLPVKPRDLDKAINKRIKEENRARILNGEKKLNRTEKKEFIDNIKEEVADTIKLNPYGFKSIGPIRTVRSYGNAIGDNLLTRANQGAPGQIDQTGYLDAVRNMIAENTPGKAGNIARAAGVAMPLGRRAVSMLGGFGSALPAIAVGEAANGGGSIDEAFARFADNPARMVPYFLSGSRGLARRTIPGLKGEVGRSNIPHNTMRSVAFSRNLVDDGTSTDNEGFVSALNNVRNKKKAEEK